VAYVLVRHKVQDYTKWKLLFDQDATNRKAIGSKGGYLFRNIDNPNEVVILLDTDDLAKVRQFIQSDDLRETMQQGGVSDQPDVYFLNEVEQVSA
jgi:hypothetical protein